MRRDTLYLADILEAAEAIECFVRGIDEVAFVANDLLRSAVLQKLTLIGEAAAHLSADFKRDNPDVEWADIIGFRNIVVHRYFNIQWEIVWVAATEDAPKLRDQLRRILENEDKV